MGPPTRTHEIDGAIAALAERQHGVVSRAQLLDVGLSPKAVRRRVEAGRLLRLHRGVYAVGHRQLKREGHWLAAVLATGPGALLSHRSAAALHGLRAAGGVCVDVTTCADRMGGPGIEVHRTRALDPADRATARGIPVTSVARTLVDLASAVPRDQLRKALREADRLRLLDVRALDACRERLRTRTGPSHDALRHALAETAALEPAFTRSPLEDAFLALLRAHALPQPEVNGHIDGMEVDALWREQRLVVELDGWEYHRSREVFERDRTRDAALTAAGWRVVRFTHRQLSRRPEHVVKTLRRLGIG